MPDAAAVVDRINVGQMRSSSPPHAMIVILFFLLRCSSAFATIEQFLQLGVHRQAFLIA